MAVLFTLLGFLAALIGVGGIFGVAAAFAAPQAAETRVKKKRYYANAKTYAAQSRKVDDDGYYERIADKLPVGTSRWWHQMDLENRGGR